MLKKLGDAARRMAQVEEGDEPAESAEGQASLGDEHTATFWQPDCHSIAETGDVQLQSASPHARAACSACIASMRRTLVDLHTSSEASVKLGADLAVLGVVGAILGGAGGVRRRDGDRLARGIASRPLALLWRRRGGGVMRGRRRAGASATTVGQRSWAAPGRCRRRRR